MTATKRLMSQKLRTMIATIKKKQEAKNSASIIEYIRPDHYWFDKLIISSQGKIIYRIRTSNDGYLKERIPNDIKILEATLWVLLALLLLQQHYEC